MDVRTAIEGRRSIKRYTDRPVTRKEIERLLETVVWAPNHRMTEPWAFYVLGDEAHDLYARLRARLKSRAVDDAEAAEAVREKVTRETRSIPRLVAVTSHVAEDPEVREEDFAAVWMGIQNLLLAAWEVGLGGYIRTGAILREPELRRCLKVPDDQRIVAILQLGEPAEIREPKPRVPASEKTRWVEEC